MSPWILSVFGGVGRRPCPGLQDKPLEYRAAPLALGDPVPCGAKPGSFFKFFEMF